MFNLMGRVMLFPYSKELLEVYKFQEMLPVKIQSVVSFKSWGYVGKNACSIDSNQVGKHLITGDFTSELSNIDSVILGSFKKYFGRANILEDYLKQIWEAEKNVLVLAQINPQLISKYKLLFQGIDKYFFAHKLDDFQRADLTSLLEIPVLGVFGSDEGCGKLEMQLKMSRGLTAAGYRVSMIGANPQLLLLGGNLYPQAFYSERLSGHQKIKILRSFAHQIIRKERADLLIISAPYGLNNFEEDRWGMDFGKTGLLAHLLIEALKPDANILCFVPGDLKWTKRALKTLEALSAAPTLAIAAKRLMRSPIQAYERFKYGLIDDQMLSLYLDIWRENLHENFIDIEEVVESDLAQIIMDALDAEKRLQSLI